MDDKTFSLDVVQRLSEKEPAWLAESRKKAFEQFMEARMPLEKDEEWRYTDLSGFEIMKFSPHGRDAGKLLASELPKKAVFTDIHSAIMEYPEIVKKYYMHSPASDKFSLLHRAFWNSGVFIYVPKDAKMAVEHLSGNGFIHTIIVMEPYSNLEFTEHFSSRSEALNTSNCEVFCAEGAKVGFTGIQNFSSQANTFSTKTAFLQKDAEMNWMFAELGSKITRLKIDTIFNGPGSRCETSGIFLGRNSQHIDITTNAFHKAPSTYNNIIAKGVMKDDASSVYRGLIKIDKIAQKTDSYLSDHTLKMSEHSVANSIPSLMIDANDVKASHGATIGHVDEEQLFYLMSRGLRRDEAEEMIVTGFLDPVISRISSEKVREEVRKLII